MKISGFFIRRQQRFEFVFFPEESVLLAVLQFSQYTREHACPGMFAFLTLERS